MFNTVTSLEKVFAVAKKPKKAGKYKPYRFVRLPEKLAERLNVIADRKFSTVTEQARQAVREYVERNESAENAQSHKDTSGKWIRLAVQ